MGADKVMMPTIRSFQDMRYFKLALDNGTIKEFTKPDFKAIV